MDVTVESRDKSALLEEVYKRLLEYDPEIVEIVQFGSSVYAPRYAKDIDLLVITRRAKRYSGYMDAANREDMPFNVDILISEVNKPINKSLLRGVLGSFKILYGNGEYLLRYAKELGDPTLEEAWSSLRVASSLLDLALKTVEPLDRDRLIREAFDALFHAARIASMVYLSLDISRWGLIKRRLPDPYRNRFEEFIDVLHVKYFYNGDYPKDKPREEFSKWLRRVRRYINDIESEIAEKKGEDS